MGFPFFPILSEITPCMAHPTQKTPAQRFRKRIVTGVVHPFWRSSSVLFARVFLRKRNIHLVTGANSTHFYSMLQLIHSAHAAEGDSVKVHAFDLGLTDSEVERFRKVHPEVSLTRFPFEDYPGHFDLNQPPDFKGEYAWKAFCVKNVYDSLRPGECLLWLDAGDFVRTRMWLIRAALFFRGFYARLTPHDMGSWTHPETMRRLGMSHVGRYAMFGSGILGMRKDDRNDVLTREWCAGSLDKGIIAPEGSSRKNHRQDQSVICLLYYKIYRFRMKPPLLSRLEREILIHRDIG